MDFFCFCTLFFTKFCYRRNLKQTKRISINLSPGAPLPGTGNPFCALDTLALFWVTFIRRVICKHQCISTCHGLDISRRVTSLTCHDMSRVRYVTNVTGFTCHDKSRVLHFVTYHVFDMSRRVTDLTCYDLSRGHTSTVLDVVIPLD